MKFLAVLAFSLIFCLVGCNDNDQNKTKENLFKLPQVKKQFYPKKITKRLTAAIMKAKLHHDRRLFATKGRRIIIPGTEPQYFSQIKKNCGIKFLPNSGDVLITDQAKQQRRSNLQFAVKYNQLMKATCYLKE